MSWFFKFKVSKFTDQLTGVKQSEILFSYKGMQAMSNSIFTLFKKTKQSKSSVERFSVHNKSHEYWAKLNNQLLNRGQASQ